MPLDEAAVLDALRPVIDPELGLSIVDLGLVYRVDVTPEAEVTVTFTTTAPGCPMTGVIGHGIVQVLTHLPGVSGATARFVLDPPWRPERMSEAARASLAGPAWR